jgi:hypothetical protein
MARKTYTKTCTKSGATFTTTILGENGLPDFSADFYRDKAQKSGYSPWCKDAERAYNKAYFGGLKKVEATRKADVIDDKKKVAIFETAMKSQRVKRASKAVAKTATKATPKARVNARAKGTKKVA